LILVVNTTLILKTYLKQDLSQQSLSLDRGSISGMMINILNLDKISVD